MKNYEKIYKRLVKELKSELTLCLKNEGKAWENRHLIDYIESSEHARSLEWVISMLPELEGKERHNILFTDAEFKYWKNKIGAK